MKQTVRSAILATISLFAIVVSVISTPAEAAAKNYRFKMWIAPLECTRNEVSDGVTTNVILTPEQCDDYLNPPVKPRPGRPSQPTPNAPDTGKFSDTWTTVGMISILLVFGASIVTLIICDRKLLKSRSLHKERR